MNEMALIVPSRGRTHNIKRLCEALQDTDSKVDLYVGVDEDDQSLVGYQLLAGVFGYNLVIASERQRFGPTLNNIAVSVANDYKYIGFCGDDHEPKTTHWDERYRQELDKLGVGVVYGNDLVMGEQIATQCAWTSNIVRALGYCVPPGYVHLFIDNFFMDLGRGLNGLVYLSDVVVQHHHPCAGTAENDVTYTEANSQENWTNDRIRHEKYISEELSGDLEKLKRLL